MHPQFLIFIDECVEISWKWEVLKPDLIGASADPMHVCIGDAQILTNFNVKNLNCSVYV